MNDFSHFTSSVHAFLDIHFELSFLCHFLSLGKQKVSFGMNVLEGNLALEAELQLSIYESFFFLKSASKLLGLTNFISSYVILSVE